MQAVTCNPHPCQLQDGLEKNNKGQHSEPARTQAGTKNSSKFLAILFLLSN